MSLFDEIWRSAATPVLDEYFGETAQADYYDGTGTLRGSYDVILSPESVLERDDDRGRRTVYQRTATLSWTASSPFTEPVIAATAKLTITEGGNEIDYSISGVLTRSASAIVLVLHRSAAQRRMT